MQLGLSSQETPKFDDIHFAIKNSIRRIKPHIKLGLSSRETPKFDDIHFAIKNSIR
jgi:hypothetical protein